MCKFFLKNNIFSIIIIFLLITVVGLLLFGRIRIDYFVDPFSLNTTNEFLNPIIDFEKQKKFYIEELDPLSLKGQIENYLNSADIKNNHIAVYFRDLTNGMWIGINERDDFLPASLFKVPIMLLWLKRIEDKRSSLKTMLSYDKAQGFIHNGAPTKLKLGKSYSIEDLIEQAIIYSDNEASLLLLENVDHNEIKDFFKKLGIDYQRNIGVKVSAKSYSVAFRMLFNSSFLNQELSNYALKILSKAQYSGGIRAAIPASIPMAHKYGFNFVQSKNNSDKVTYYLHHISIVYHPKKPFLLTIMTEGNSLLLLDTIIQNVAQIVIKNLNSQIQIQE